MDQDINEELYEEAGRNYPDIELVLSLIENKADVFYQNPNYGSVLYNANYWLKENTGWKDTELLCKSISIIENEIRKQLYKILKYYLSFDLIDLVINLYINLESSF